MTPTNNNNNNSTNNQPIIPGVVLLTDLFMVDTDPLLYSSYSFEEVQKEFENHMFVVEKYCFKSKQYIHENFIHLSNITNKNGAQSLNYHMYNVDVYNVSSKTKTSNLLFHKTSFVKDIYKVSEFLSDKPKKDQTIMRFIRA